MAKNVTVARSNETERAQIEARRGIARDNEGRIIRSPDWRKKRIEWLKAKRSDLQNRIKNIDAEIKEQQKAI